MLRKTSVHGAILLHVFCLVASLTTTTLSLSVSTSSATQQRRRRNDVPAPSPTIYHLDIKPFRQRDLQHDDEEDSEDENNNSNDKNNARRRYSYTPAPSPTRSSWSNHYKRTHDVNDFYSHLSDVWLCLGMALTWTVWILSSFIKSDAARYQRESVLVRGHVLQVSLQDDSLGTGIPVYTAVIDYMLENSISNESPQESNNNNNIVSQIQIRKNFITQQRLEEGFANVELLVLPEEPTHSVLRDDWEKEMEQSEMDGSLWQRPLCKRVVLSAAALLVAGSVFAAIMAVTNLDPLFRWQGWLSVCIGVGMLLPSAIFINRILTAFQNSLYPTEQVGVVISGGQADTIGKSASMTDPFWKSPFYCDSLDAGMCDDEEPVESKSPLWRGIQMPDAGCYSIQFPPKPPSAVPRRRSQEADLQDSAIRSSQHHQQVQQALAQETSSVSTVSSISLGARSFSLDDDNGSS